MTKDSQRLRCDLGGRSWWDEKFLSHVLEVNLFQELTECHVDRNEDLTNMT